MGKVEDDDGDGETCESDGLMCRVKCAISRDRAKDNHVYANLTSVTRTCDADADGLASSSWNEMSEPTRAVTPPNNFLNNVNSELTATPERVRQVELNRLRGI